MSFRLEMLQVARVAPKLLGDSADLVSDFLSSRLAPGGGGFLDRADRPDLYYTVFGIEGLMALQKELPRDALRQWLTTFGDGEGLDFVHLSCLARCWASLGGGLSEAQKQSLAGRLEAWRTPDGGYHQAAGRRNGSAYGCLIAFGAYQDLGMLPPDPMSIARCMDSLETPDGAWSNEPGLTLGSTTATSAMLSLYRNMQLPPPPAAVDWLLRQCLPEGGFLAVPGAPIPDLLSTAVALHALSNHAEAIEMVRERCLDFIDSLWSATGGFHGNWTDDTLDPEYTYYGLLALGHLAL
jgi:prenyltransferase beta subunit